MTRLRPDFVYRICKWWCHKEVRENERVRARHVVTKDQLDKYIAERWRTSGCHTDSTKATPLSATCKTIPPKVTGRPSVKPVLMVTHDSPQEFLRRLRGKSHYSRMVRMAVAAAA